ncbi:MAG: SCO family protein [Ralstonia sp.]
MPAAPRGWGPALALAAVMVMGVAGFARLTQGFAVWTLDDRRAERVAERTLQFPPVEIRDQQGQPATLFTPGRAEPARMLLVSFIYTRCMTVCRALGAEFTQLKRRITADGLAGKVGLLSISIDPARDDTRSLAAYAADQQAQLPGWRIVAPTSAATLQHLLRTLDVVAIPDGLGGFEHNGGIHVVDAHGRVLAIYDLEAFEQAYAFEQGAAR